MWKNIEDMFIRFDRMYERDGRTDRHRHRMTAKAARQKPFFVSADVHIDSFCDLMFFYSFVMLYDRVDQPVNEDIIVYTLNILFNIDYNHY